MLAFRRAYPTGYPPTAYNISAGERILDPGKTIRPPLRAAHAASMAQDGNQGRKVGFDARMLGCGEAGMNLENKGQKVGGKPEKKGVPRIHGRHAPWELLFPRSALFLD
jgi:hypothetical protein